MVKKNIIIKVAAIALLMFINNGFNFGINHILHSVNYGYYAVGGIDLVMLDIFEIVKLFHDE